MVTGLGFRVSLGFKLWGQVSGLRVKGFGFMEPVCTIACCSSYGSLRKR